MSEALERAIEDATKAIKRVILLASGDRGDLAQAMRELTKALTSELPYQEAGR